MNGEDDDPLMVQVREALDRLGDLEEPLKDALVEGVREALDRGESSVSVVTPEKKRKKRTSKRANTPKLRVVDPPPPEPEPRPLTIERRRRELIRRTALPDTLELGRIRLPGGDDVWQTLRHGQQPAVYRVHCDHGELHVAADGALVLRLEAGQSADVEGAVVRVRGCAGPAQGRYTVVR
jgi:hypothetical protein